MLYVAFMVSDKKIFSTRINNEIIKELKHLAVDTEKSLGHLLEEAITDLLEKYKDQFVK